MLENTKERVGKRFKQLRENDLNMNQIELSRLLGYKTQGAYSKIESGGNFPSIEAYSAMARLFKVRHQWLAYGEGNVYMTDEEYTLLLAQEKEAENNQEMIGYKERTPSVPTDKTTMLKAIDDLRHRMNDELDKLTEQVNNLK